MGFLDQLAHKHDTDKKSGIHGYTAHYERWFGASKSRVNKILEIGVASGASLKLWEEYFPEAMIYAIDSNPDCLRFQGKRTRIHIADQANASELQAVVEQAGKDFDLIIDDGGHRMDQQLTSFRTLFPCVRSGGVYVVEDLHTSYWTDYLGGPPGTPGTMVEFLKDLVDDVNKMGIGYGDHERAIRHATETSRELSAYSKTVASVQFYPSIAFIERR